MQCSVRIPTTEAKNEAGIPCGVSTIFYTYHVADICNAKQKSYYGVCFKRYWEYLRLSEKSCINKPKKN